MNRGVSYVLGLLFFCFGSQAQDFFYNQQLHLIATNPSFAGSNGGIRNQTNSQLNWSNYSLYSSGDVYLKKLKAGIAVTYQHDDDQFGMYKREIFNISYAQYFYLLNRQMKLIPSLQAGGFVNRNRYYVFNCSTCDYGWVNDAAFPARGGRKSNFDMSAGLLMQYKKLLVGVSAYHITQPDDGLYGVHKLPCFFNFYSSYNFITRKDLLIHLSLSAGTNRFEEYAQLMVKSVLFKHYIVGIGDHNKDNLVYTAGYRHDYFSVSFTAKHNLDKATAIFELGASYNLRAKEERKQLTCIENW